MIKKLFRWIFATEIKSLETTVAICENQTRLANEAISTVKAQEARIKAVFGNIECSMDTHIKYGKNWAVISIEGQETDYIKFVSFPKENLKQLQDFLSNFDRSKIDAAPNTTGFIRIERKRINRKPF